PDEPESGRAHADDDLDHADRVDGAAGAAGEDALARHASIDRVDELRKVLQAELATDTTQHYLNQIGARPLLTAVEEVHFATLAKSGDFGARQKMI
ncbi:sigma-70 factor domain-containing protein, partial [Escherichia coli]|uniref:sigma-70 factor domain-containing protein n=1 Tax=Escherichia coli TaxID=562 RepID=UPI002AC87F63